MRPDGGTGPRVREGSSGVTVLRGLGGRRPRAAPRCREPGGVDVEPVYAPGLDDDAPCVAVDLVAGTCRLRGGPLGFGRTAAGLFRYQAGPPLCGLVPEDSHDQVSGARGDFAGEQARGDDEKELEECRGAELEREFVGRLR